jgi:hypothetical protein
MSKQEMLTKIEERVNGYESSDKTSMLMDIMSRFLNEEQLQQIMDEQEIN